MIFFNLMVFLTVAYVVLVLADKQKTVLVKKTGYALAILLVVLAVVAQAWNPMFCGKSPRGKMQMSRNPQMKTMMQKQGQPREQKMMERTPPTKIVK